MGRGKRVKLTNVKRPLAPAAANPRSRFPSNCRHVLRTAHTSDFNDLYDQMRHLANGTDRYVEVLPRHLAFHFEDFEAHGKFYSFVVGRHIATLRPGEDIAPVDMMVATVALSDKFKECRLRVHDDAFEARLAQHMIKPLIQDMGRIKVDYVYQSGVFMRRSLARYHVLALYRLLDKPNEKGSTGITASIASLLEMARAEDVLSGHQIDRYSAEFEKIKADGAWGEYDLIQAIRDLRNIQVAHSLIPHKDPTDEIWAHHLVDFSDRLFSFMIDLEGDLTEATGTALSSIRLDGDRFRDNADAFWQLLVTERTPGEMVWTRR
jgi:AbiU2